MMVRLATSFLAAGCLLAGRLPVRVFDTRDGLAHNRVNCLVNDTRGFLWICTDEGLSRFDGSRMETYRQSDGLPHAHINALIETRSGALWIGTDGGVVRLNPKGVRGRGLFSVHRLPGGTQSQAVNALVEEPSGAIWCATSDGLFQMDPSGPKFTAAQLPLPAAGRDAHHVTRLLLDQAGRLWAGTIEGGLLRRGRDGAWRQLTREGGLTYNFVDALTEDVDDWIWVGLRVGGAHRVRALDRAPWFEVGERWYRKGAADEVRDLYRDSNGRVWLAGLGLSQYGERNRVLGTGDGLPAASILRVAEDRQGNLWLGTFDAGAVRIPREGPVTWSTADGYHAGSPVTLGLTPSGEVLAWTGDAYRRSLLRVEANRLTTVPFRPPARAPAFGTWSRHQFTRDAGGAWWFASDGGALRFSPGNLPGSYAPLGMGGPERAVIRHVFRSTGGLWAAGVDELFFWPPRGPWRRIAARDVGLASMEISTFAEPAPGLVWFGQRYGERLLRWRDGRIEQIATETAPKGTVNHLFADHLRRVWVATATGLYRADDPGAAEPRFRRFGREQGLASEDISFVTEDRWGRIYAGTAAGLDRLSGEPPQVTRFDREHGLAPGKLQDAAADAAGDIWVATSVGMSRLTPQPDRPVRPAHTYFAGFVAGGVAHPVPADGAERIGPYHLASGAGAVEIAYGAIHLEPGSPLQFETSLNGGRWTQPRREGIWAIAGLSPGAYRFEVRATGAAGVAGPPAVAQFVIAAPFWRRWWFITLTGAMLLGLVWLAHRVELRRALALARERERISSDLHDDVGSALSRMVLLADAPGDPESRLRSIGAAGRELLEDMSDIVWSIDPRGDRAGELAERIRDAAAGICGAAGLAWELDAGAAPCRGLPPSARRHVYLIFKEALNNAARHSGASRVRMRLAAEDGRLEGEICDDGRGFDPADAPGNGLRNLRRRAAAVGGELVVETAPGRGTAIRFHAPLGRRGRS